MILPPARITISCSMISPCRALSLLRRTGRRCQTTRRLFAPGGDTDCRPSRRICFRLYARAGFLHLFRVLEMQCFVLSYLLSPKPTRRTLRPASRKHGLCSITGAQTHSGELCTASAPAQPNGGAFFGNRSRHWIVRLFICKKRLFRPLLALRAEPGRAPIAGRQFSQLELRDQSRDFSRFRRACTKRVDRSDDSRARSSVAAR